MTQTVKPLTLTQLRCDAMLEPIGIDDIKPCFSWLNKSHVPGQQQSAWQIIISSSFCDPIKPDIWDSGRINSTNYHANYYDGPELESCKRYYWQVRVWDQEGRLSGWSPVTHFETAFLSQDEWQAKWIGGHLYRLRKEFSLPSRKEIKSARVYISGLGYFELYINNHKVGDEVLSPGQSRFRENTQDVGLNKTYRALYRSYDVTEYLQKGMNVAGIMLGQGMFNDPFIRKRGACRAIMQLKVCYEDSTAVDIVTDKSWTGSSGPVVDDNIFDGEKYDARLEDNWLAAGYDQEWETVQTFPWLMLSSHLQPMRVTELLKPAKINETATGLFIVDFGQNIAGWVRIKASGPAGTTIQIRTAERLYPDGSLDVNSLGDWAGTAACLDRYTLKGEGIETWEPRFTYHGFQYAEIAGFPGTLTADDITACAVHDDVDFTSHFDCSNDTINAIHKMYQWSLRSNMHSIPTDCCNRRERAGWTGDALVTAFSAMQMFDLRIFYKKYFIDMDDSMAADGRMQDVVPYNTHTGLRPGHVAWHGSRIILPWYYYWIYGDLNILHKHYKPMRKYILWLESNDPGDYTLPVEFACYGGDHSASQDIEGSPESKIALATAYYYFIVCLFAEICQITGHTDEAIQYGMLSDKIKHAFNQRFLKEGYYCSNFQVDNAIPLDFGLVPEGSKRMIIKNIVHDIAEKQKYHVTTGIPGTFHLLKSLADNDQNDIVYRVANEKTKPGWAYLLSEGFTTTCSDLYGHYSKNHPMTGAAIGNWLYLGLAGIKITAPGFEMVQIRPFVPDDMDYLTCELHTVKGKLAVQWAKEANHLTMDIKVPVGTTVEIRLPVSKNKLSKVALFAKPLWEDDNFTSNDIVTMHNNDDEHLWLTTQQAVALKLWVKKRQSHPGYEKG